MNRIEEYFRLHRDDFDSEEPPAGHFDRFSSRLHQNPAQTRPRTALRIFLRVAAFAVVLTGVTLFLFDPSSARFLHYPSNASAMIPGDVFEAMEYYDQQALIQLEEIRKISGKSPDGKAILENAERQIRLLDENTRELRSALACNPQDERITTALIRNQQMKEGVLSSIRNNISTTTN